MDTFEIAQNSQSKLRGKRKKRTNRRGAKKGTQKQRGWAAFDGWSNHYRLACTKSYV